MVPALVVTPAGEVVWVASAAKGKLFSGPGLSHRSLLETTCYEHICVSSTEPSSSLALAPGQLSLHGKHSHGWIACCPCFYIRQGGNNMALTAGENRP